MNEMVSSLGINDEFRQKPCKFLGLVTQLRLAIGFIIRPGSALRELANTQFWVVQFFLLSILIVILGYLMVPFNVRATLAGLPPDIPAAFRSEMAVKVIHTQALGLKLAALFFFAKICFTAAVLWLLAIGAGGSGKFKNAFVLTIYVNSILVIESWAAFGALAWHGLVSIRTPFDLQPKIGLNCLIGNTSLPINALLGCINLFEIWFIIVLTMGLMRMFGLRRNWAAGIATAYWAFSVMMQVGIAAIVSLVGRVH